MSDNYPPGATWVCTGYDQDGDICCHGKVWKEVRTGGWLELLFSYWRYEVRSASGSLQKRDWAHTKKSAVERAKLAMVGCGADEFNLRFKRVNDPPQ